MHPIESKRVIQGLSLEFTLDANSNRANITRYLPLMMGTFPTTNRGSYSYNSDNQPLTAPGRTLDVFLADADEFRKLYKHSEEKHDKVISIRAASLRDIKKMKRDSRGPVDLADIKLIEEARGIIRNKKT